MIKESESEFYVLKCRGSYICRTASDWGPSHIPDSRIECARKFATYDDALEFSKSPGEGWFEGGYRPAKVHAKMTYTISVFEKDL